jgi:hypothetical protein
LASIDVAFFDDRTPARRMQSKALRRLADAHPDPNTGAMTAISAALDAKLVQVFIQHPQGDAVKAASLR